MEPSEGVFHSFYERFQKTVDNFEAIDSGSKRREAALILDQAADRLTGIQKSENSLIAKIAAVVREQKSHLLESVVYLTIAKETRNIAKELMMFSVNENEWPALRIILSQFSGDTQKKKAVKRIPIRLDPAGGRPPNYLLRVGIILAAEYFERQHGYAPKRNREFIGYCQTLLSRIHFTERELSNLEEHVRVVLTEFI
jgi:hypothetical protein